MWRLCTWTIHHVLSKRHGIHTEWFADKHTHSYVLTTQRSWVACSDFTVCVLWHECSHELHRFPNPSSVTYNMNAASANCLFTSLEKYDQWWYFMLPSHTSFSCPQECACVCVSVWVRLSWGGFRVRMVYIGLADREEVLQHPWALRDKQVSVYPQC